MGKSQQHESPLFLMRVWGVDGVTPADGERDGAAPGDSRATPVSGQSDRSPHPESDSVVRWRGKLLNVPTGEAHYFSGWPALIDLLQTLFPDETTGDGQASKTEPKSPG